MYGEVDRDAITELIWPAVESSNETYCAWRRASRTRDIKLITASLDASRRWVRRDWFLPGAIELKHSQVGDFV